MSKPRYQYNGTHSAVAVRVMRILHGLCAGERVSKHELAARAQSTPASLERVLDLLHACGLCRIGGWRSVSPSLEALYEFGPGAHAPRRAPASAHPLANSRTRARILGALTADMIASEIVARTGGHAEYIGKLLRAMARPGPDQDIHIVGWLRNHGTGGGNSPVYRRGAGKNKARPKPEPNAIIKARRRANVRADYSPADARRIFASAKKGGLLRLVANGRVIYQRRGHAAITEGESA